MLLIKMIKMIKMILILFVTIKTCFANLIWLRIPQFYVSNYVTNFLDNHQINNCFYKYEDENNLLLKCWKNNQLTNVEITIKNNHKKRAIFYDSISI
jgi:hypothetical protein